MNKSFKVFAFDGLRGYAGDYRDELAEARARGRSGFGAALRSVGSQPGQLTAGSLVRLISEQGPVEDWETTPWTTRVVHNCTGEYGTVQVPLVVNRQVLLRTVIDLPVEGSPAQGLDPAFVRPRAYTTVALREPVTLESVYNTAHTGGLFGEYPADIDTATLGEGCKGAQTLGVGVEVALPEGVLLEVVEAASGSTAWLLPKEPVPPVVPEPPSGPSRSGVPTWVPVVGGLGLLLCAGWLIFGRRSGR